MKQEINPKGTSRAQAFELWMKAPNPMVTSSVMEFYLLPVGDKLIRYDSIAVNTIVKNAEGEVSSCDIMKTTPSRYFVSDCMSNL